MIEPAELMRLAIDKCRQGIAGGQSPFGSAVAMGDRLLAVAHNTVLATLDITAHAEVNALREANRQAGSIHLPGAIVATTCEPCPMCLAALHWARVGTVYYGASIETATAAGFNEMQLAAQDMVRLGKSSVHLVGGVLGDECQALFPEWLATPRHRAY